MNFSDKIIEVKKKTDLINKSKIKKNIKNFLIINNKLKDNLIISKNKINNNPLWDEAKKFMNEYEFIFSTFKNNDINTLTKKKPISRSYFKLWEIIHNHNLINNFISTTHIAEGPGGFIEALCDYCKYYSILLEKINGITLISNDNKVPNWKLKDFYYKKFPIKLHYGKDNTGNIYSLDNIDHFILNIGKNSNHFITADGGFDFSNDFNNQESKSFFLMLCEFYISVCLQCTDGSLLIKVFDLFHINTLILINSVSLMYEKLIIIKPCTSRPANSEKYILFQKFTNNETIIESLRDAIIYNDFEYLLFNEDNFIHFLNDICEYNITYTSRQIIYINKTLSYMNQNNKDNSFYEKILKKNKKKSKIWCEKYNLDTIDLN